MIARVYPKSVKLISQAGEICVSRKQKEFDELLLFVESEGKFIFRGSKFAEYELNDAIFLRENIPVSCPVRRYKRNFTMSYVG